MCHEILTLISNSDHHITYNFFIQYLSFLFILDFINQSIIVQTTNHKISMNFIRIREIVSGKWDISNELPIEVLWSYVRVRQKTMVLLQAKTNSSAVKSVAINVFILMYPDVFRHYRCFELTKFFVGFHRKWFNLQCIPLCYSKNKKRLNKVL